MLLNLNIFLFLGQDVAVLNQNLSETSIGNKPFVVNTYLTVGIPFYLARIIQLYGTKYLVIHMTLTNVGPWACLAVPAKESNYDILDEDQYSLLIWDGCPLPLSMHLWEGHTWSGEEGTCTYPARSAELILAINGITDIAARLSSNVSNPFHQIHNMYFCGKTVIF